MSGKDPAAVTSPPRQNRSSSAPEAAPRAAERSRSRSRPTNAHKEQIHVEYNKQLETLMANKRDEPPGRSYRRDSPSPHHYRVRSRGSNRDSGRPRDGRPSSRSPARRRSRDRRSRDRKSRDRRPYSRSPARRRSRDRKSRDRRPYSRSHSRRRMSRSRSWRRRKQTPPRRSTRDWRDRRETPGRRMESSRARRRSRSRSRNKQPCPRPNEEPRRYQEPRSNGQNRNDADPPQLENDEIIRRAQSKWRNKPKTVPTSFQHPKDDRESDRRKWKKRVRSPSPVPEPPVPAANPLAGLPSKHPLVTKGHLDQEKGVVWMPTPILEPIKTKIPFLNPKPTGYAGKPRPMMTCSAHGKRRSVWDLKLNESGFWECLPGSKCVGEDGLSIPNESEQGDVLKRYTEKLMLNEQMACHVAAAQEQAERMLKMNAAAGQGPVPPLPQGYMGKPR